MEVCGYWALDCRGEPWSRGWDLAGTHGHRQGRHLSPGASHCYRLAPIMRTALSCSTEQADFDPPTPTPMMPTASPMRNTYA